jgi:DNA-binding XRE family transcriptional regulator
MQQKKRERLESAGWRVGTVQEFLNLSDDEALFVELKLALRNALKERRNSQGLTQTELAKRLGSSQSRVAKMEAGDTSVSLDLLVRALLATGASAQDLADVIAAKNTRVPPEELRPPS